MFNYQCDDWEIMLCKVSLKLHLKIVIMKLSSDSDKYRDI